VVPFKYLGLPVGANSRKMSTWEPMLEQLNKRLNSWGNKYASLCGRIVLLNSVLNAIPIYYMGSNHFGRGCWWKNMGTMLVAWHQVWE